MSVQPSVSPAMKRTPGPQSLRAARWTAAIWRFQTLRRARHLFAGVSDPCVLERPFFSYRLSVDVSRSDAQKLLYLEGERFLAERHVLRRLLKPGMRVADVGANIGYYLLFLLRHVGPGGTIYCFEPEPENLQELRRNIAANAAGNARIFPVAAGDRTGNVSLHPGINGVVAEDGSGSLTVPLAPLDRLLTEGVDLLKVDVEGYEGRVLAGARKLVETHRPALFVEIHPQLLATPTTVDDILAFLRAHYTEVELFAPSSQASLATKILARYLPATSVRRIRRPRRFLARCRDGSHTAPFWAVARPEPPGARA